MAAAEVLGLYRAMQKSARRFTNYNVRECVETRVAIRHRPDFPASVDVGIGPAINPNRR
jgi:hypothetical protein